MTSTTDASGASWRDRFHSICLAILCLCLLSPAAQAREIVLPMDDGSAVKVFMFEPDDHGEGPWPLTILMPGGDGNEYVARAQFWLGRELARQGWIIAVPVSSTNTAFVGENGQKIPVVIAKLQEQADVLPGKALLVGVSSGGSAALELAAQHPEQYYGVVAVPGMLADLSVIGDMQNLPVYLRIAEEDMLRWNTRMPGLVSALEDGGARVDARLMPRGKHVFRLDWHNLSPWIDSLELPDLPGRTESP
ncbi:dienelactone hydrolase family protein [Pseudohongiella spirulinae]|nr:alpha/beta hydrolase-fold protein [Pseudohongiella spirulinae]